jgi:transcriptional regulator with XRE-family HTH domain
VRSFVKKNKMSNMLNDSDRSSEQVMATVAENIRTLRERRGMSLSELAQRAGVGKSTLSMLESGKANPSIETLWAIAAALGVPFGQVIEPQEPVVRVVRAGEGTRIHAESAHVSARLIAASHRRGPFEVYIFEAEPGAVHEATAHIRGTVEHQYIVNGRMRCGPIGAEVVLGPGDIATFPADQPHSYEALEAGTRALQIVDYE